MARRLLTLAWAAALGAGAGALAGSGACAAGPVVGASSLRSADGVVTPAYYRGRSYGVRLHRRCSIPPSVYYYAPPAAYLPPAYGYYGPPVVYYQPPPYAYAPPLYSYYRRRRRSGTTAPPTTSVPTTLRATALDTTRAGEGVSDAIRASAAKGKGGRLAAAAEPGPPHSVLAPDPVFFLGI